MKRVCAWLLLVSVLAAVLAGCRSKGMASEHDIQVVFIPKVTGNAFFETANQGAQSYAKKHGFTVNYQGNPQAAVEAQIDIIRKAIKDEADALCISALDADALDAVLKQAMAAGIKVATWDSDVAGDARQVMVSQGTPEQLGTMLVEMGAKSLADRGVDLSTDKVRYVWHYSQPGVTDQNSWWQAGEAYIKTTYPHWENVEPQNYYSHQDYEKALEMGKQILVQHPAIDLVICNDSTSLPAQAQAAQDMGLNAGDVTITGFASPQTMRQYCQDGIVERWGLWDCKMQGALGCYMAFYLAEGNELRVGDKIDVPDIGIVSVMPNTVLDPNAHTAANSGVVLLPERIEFTSQNVDDYDF